MQLVDARPRMASWKPSPAWVLPFTLALSGFGTAHAQDGERLAESRRQAIARGRAELRGALYGPVAADPASLAAAQVLRALLASGSGANDPELAPLLRRLAESPVGDDPEVLAAQVRCLALAGPKTFRGDVERRVAALEGLADESGGWRSPRPAKDRERPDDDTLTALVLLAMRDVSRIGVTLPDPVVGRALDFLLERRARDGSFGHLGRRARPHGRATATAAAVLLWARTEERFAERHEAIDAALAPALAWLREEFTPDRNPGTPQQLFAWHEDLALLLSLGALPFVRRGETRPALERFLVSYELPEGGWNREASLQDVLRPPIPDDRVPGRLPAGVPIARVRADLLDTARAILALSTTDGASEAEWALALGLLLEDPRQWPRERDDREAFQRFLVENARRTSPVLIRALAAPERTVRALAFDALREIAGEDFGYSAHRKVEDQAEAIQAWQRWWFEKGRFL